MQPLVEATLTLLDRLRSHLATFVINLAEDGAIVLLAEDEVHRGFRIPVDQRDGRLLLRRQSGA